MRRVLWGTAAFLTMCTALTAVWAVPLFLNVNNTFGGGGVVEAAGHSGAAPGTQAALFSYPGAEVSLDASGVSGSPLVVNLPQAAIGGPVPPFGAVLEMTQVKDGSTVAFGQEMTVVVGGLFPTSLRPVWYSVPAGSASIDNGLAPGSTAGDGNPDQLARGPVGMVQYRVLFGPGTSPFPFPSPPVFEIYEDIPPGLDLNIGVGALAEEEFDFDGAGPAVPPPTASPSQFENGTDGFPLPNNVSAATDGSVFAAGFIDVAVVRVTFFDPSVIGSGGTPAGTYIYKVNFTAKGRVTHGSILPQLAPIEVGGASDGGDINITFATTVFGEAFVTSGNATDGFAPGDGEDPNATWDIRTSTAANSGDASFGILPVEPPGGEGCTPGFWKAKNHRDAWADTGYSIGDLYDVVFGVDAPGDYTLLGALKLGGGGVKKLMRHSVAALLNAAHPCVDYAYTEAQVIALVQNAFATDDYSIGDEFADQNELGCDFDG